jgi:hypothetical protein
MAPRTGLEEWRKEKSSLYRDSNSESSAVQSRSQSLYRLSFQDIYLPLKMGYIYIVEIERQQATLPLPAEDRYSLYLLLQFVHCMSLFKGQPNVKMPNS